MALTVRRSVYALVFLFWGRQVTAKYFPWAKLNFKCVDPPGQDHSFRLKGDWSNKMSVDDCKSKCHKHVYCEGFNYEISTGTCYWKSDVDEQFSSEIEQPDPDYVCYIAERVVTISTPPVDLPPASTPPPASTAPLNKDTWVKQTFVCMDPDGADYSLKVDGKSYQQLNLDKCKTACAQLQGCLAFNYNTDNYHCNFKYTVDIAYSKKTQEADFVQACYMLPGQVTVAPWTTTTVAPASTKAPWTTLYPYVRQPFICVDPDGKNYDLAVDGNFFEVSNINHCEAKCSGTMECMAFNYNTVSNLCHYKNNIDISYSQNHEQPDSDSACYVVNRPSTSAGQVTTAPTNPGAPGTTPNSNPDTLPPDTPQPPAPGPGGNSPTPAPTPLRTVTTAPAPVVPVTGAPGLNETVSDDCPKHVWQGVRKISRCAGKKTNMYSAEVFGIVISTILLLAGAAVGVFFGVKRCSNRDDDIIDFSVRKRLLGLQLGNFKQTGKQDYNDFDYDAI